MQEFLKFLAQGNSRRLPGLANLLKSNPSCCWYPSAGDDLRDMLYLSDAYKDYVGNDAFPAEPPQPQLFIHTDFHMNPLRWARNHGLLFNDWRSNFIVTAGAYLGRVDITHDKRIVPFDPTEAHGAVYAFRISRHSEFLPPLPDAWLIYCVCENAAFCEEVLLANNAQIDTVVHIRYGGGLGGGGRGRGGWIVDILPKLGTSLFVNEGRYREWSDGDTAAVELYPSLRSENETLLHRGYQMPASKWSDYGDNVMWCYPRDPADTRPITPPELY